MALKAVVPGVPKSVRDRELLEEDLRQIGCHGFMGRPWELRMEDMVVELLGDKDNRWEGTVRQAPERWTVKEWWKVYGFARGGEGMASRTDWFIDGRFSGWVNPKDGYAVVDCKESRTRRVLEFLVPLLYPEKPTRVTITVGNTIFGHANLSLRLPPLPLARAATSNREEGVSYQGDPPKVQCGVRGRGRSKQPGKPG